MMGIEALVAGEAPSVEGLAALLACDDPRVADELMAAAYEVKVREVGAVAWLRGLVEISNVCRCDCRYCGIRRSNDAVERYTVPVDEVLAAGQVAFESGFGSVVLQGGERGDAAFVDDVEEMVRGLRDLSAGRLAITLSLGEQSPATYRRWREAGAERYLLRIETTNRRLFDAIHTGEQDFDARLNCLDELRAQDWQVGTGVMIGLPGQTAGDLARDILFMRDRDVDMVGMGPFIPHAGTPLAGSLGPEEDYRPRQLDLSLRMIACARLVLRDVNIASTTALQALHPQGRERGLRAGANVLMPNLTHVRHRRGYQLYDGKPGLDEGSEESLRALERSVAAVGEAIGYGHPGTSPHYRRRVARGDDA